MDDGSGREARGANGELAERFAIELIEQRAEPGLHLVGHRQAGRHGRLGEGQRDGAHHREPIAGRRVPLALEQHFQAHFRVDHAALQVLGDLGRVPAGNLAQAPLSVADHRPADPLAGKGRDVILAHPNVLSPLFLLLLMSPRAASAPLYLSSPIHRAGSMTVEDRIYWNAVKPDPMLPPHIEKDPFPARINQR